MEVTVVTTIQRKIQDIQCAKSTNLKLQKLKLTRNEDFNLKTS